MKFLLQTIDGEVRQDFTFTLVDALDYQKWKGNEVWIKRCELKDLTLSLQEQIPNIDEYVPVGTIEFVNRFIDTFIKPNGSEEIKPLNVPKSMLDYIYTRRYIDNFELNKDTRVNVYETLQDWICDDLVFIKSNDVIKSPVNDFYHKEDVLDYNKLPDGNYQISEFIDIISEWRCFVYKGELVGIQYYSGDFTIYPNIENIKEMVKGITTDENINTGITFDVAVVDFDGDIFTILVEVHEFFSCGLYGFNDYNSLPYMFMRTFNKLKNKLLK